MGFFPGNRQFTLRFKPIFLKLIRDRKTQHLARNLNTAVKISYIGCFERTKKLSAEMELH